MDRILVTGGAGFIGSYLVDRLLIEGNSVVVLDNLSTGSTKFIKRHFNNAKFRFVKVDIASENIERLLNGIEEIWHLAGSSDTRTALENTRVDIEQNIVATHNILETARKRKVKRVLFASSSTVYGEAKIMPTPEHYQCRPISLYGASKLACEGLISAYSQTFGLDAMIFRLANIIGPRITHGVISDFVRKLGSNPNELTILGNGNQRKSYLYIEDCIDGMLLARRNVADLQILNLGSEDWITVKEIVKIVCERFHLNPKIKFGNADRGWKGDVPFMLLDVSQIEKFGWKPRYNSRQAVKLTARSFES